MLSQFNKMKINEVTNIYINLFENLQLYKNKTERPLKTVIKSHYLKVSIVLTSLRCTLTTQGPLSFYRHAHVWAGLRRRPHSFNAEVNNKDATCGPLSRGGVDNKTDKNLPPPFAPSLPPGHEGCRVLKMALLVQRAGVPWREASSNSWINESFNKQKQWPTGSPTALTFTFLFSPKGSK